MSSNWDKGSDTRWRVFRLAILERDKWTCVIGNQEVCTVTAEHVDHIIPLEMGGEKYDPLNCRAACQPCNLARKKANLQYEPPYKSISSW